MKPFLFMMFFCLFLFGEANNVLKAEETQTRIYVKTNGDDANDGSSWDNAIASLSTALTTAYRNSDIAEIWVAQGTYYPTSLVGDGTDDRDMTFVLMDNVSVYGGFDGTEPSLEARADTTGATTILSGDIGTANDNSDNCYHVVISVGDVGSASLNGFTITGGNANGTSRILYCLESIHQSSGGGMYNYESSPTLQNVTLTGNSAKLGGGIYNYDSAITITNANISNNSSSNLGGGIYNNDSAPSLINVTISGNSASESGGGMYNIYSTNLTLTNLTITGNYASKSGGGMYNNSSDPTLTNNTITGNSASTGGGIYNNSSASDIYNSIIWGNTASSEASNIYTNSHYINYYYCLIEGSGSSNNWDVDFGTDGGNNIDAIDSPFVSWIDPSVNDWETTIDGDYHLNSDSHCINSGNNDYVSIETDLDGNKRIYNDGIVDMGAYESEYKVTAPPTFSLAEGTYYETQYIEISSVLDGATIYYTTDGSTPSSSSSVYTATIEVSNTTTINAIVHYNNTYSTVSSSTYFMYSNNATNGILYIKPTASGKKDGSSWSNATSLTNALAGVSANNSDNEVEQIWVAQGTYYPESKPVNINDDLNSTCDRDMTFVLAPDVAIYGGFNGAESTLNARADTTGATTILSGDIGITNDSTDNCYHVIISIGDIGTTSLNGFTISGGCANGESNITVNNLSIQQSCGGGMFNKTSSPTLCNITFIDNSASSIGGGICNYESSPTISNTTFTGNCAGSGGGLYNYMSFPSISDVTITDNKASGYGGGIYIGPSSSPVLTNMTISDNDAEKGGGLYIGSESSPILTSITISDNNAEKGGGLYIYYKSFPSISHSTFSRNTASDSGGGIFNDNSHTVTTSHNYSPTIANTTFVGNSAKYGGAFYNYYTSAQMTNVTLTGNSANYGGGMYNRTSSLILTNVTITGNYSKYRGGAMYNYFRSSSEIYNSIIWGNVGSNNISIYNYDSSPSYYYSLIEDGGSSNNWDDDFGTDGGNNIDSEDSPFVTWIDPSEEDWGATTEGNYHLNTGSICIDAGSNSYIDGMSTDLDGNNRINNDIVDMGAYESGNTTIETPTFSLAQGTYYKTQYVEISSDIDGATIYFTTNGTTPDNSSAIYSSAIEISKSTTINAIVYSDGVYSEVASASYTISSVGSPIFSSEEDTYYETQSIRLTSLTEGAAIYYTTDGTTPNNTSKAFSAAIKISKTTTIKAVAYIEGTYSDVVSVSYTIASVETPIFSTKEGTYYETLSIKLVSPTEGAIIYYTLDGTTPDNSSSVYSSAIEIDETTTINAIAYIAGVYSDIYSVTYTIFSVETPTFSIEEGIFGATQYIELASTTEGATIYYTLDGTTPDNTSETYSSEIEISETMTINAVAYLDGIYSDVASATYTFSISTRIETLSDEIKIYPNPFNSFITVECSNMKSIQLCNITGDIIKSMTIDGTNKTKVSTTQLSSGVYIIKITKTDGSTSIEKLLKE